MSAPAVTPAQLRTARQAVGSQTEVARLLGITVGSLSRLENGHAACRRWHLYALMWLQHTGPKVAP